MQPDELAGDSASPPHGRTWRYGVALAVVALGGLVAWWIWSLRQSLAAETRAAEALEELGALVVMDGDRRHVASVNLSMLQSPDDLAKALEHLPALHRLNSLDASRTEIADEHLETIGKLSSLNSLSLIETGITDKGARELAALENLEALHLASTKITGEALTALEALENLRILDVSATKVAGNLAPLAGLRQLEWLVLRELTLDDDALPKLAGLQSLRRLSLEGSKYSPASLEKLQTARPQLAVDR